MAAPNARRWTVCALALAVWLGAACTRPESGLHVVVQGTLVPGEDFDRLALVAYLARDRTPLYAETLEGEALKLPVSFNLLSGPGTPAGTEVEVLASAERAGEVVSAVRGTAALMAEEGGRLELTLPPIATRSHPEWVELCDNGSDDDGDSLADCADPECEAQACRAGGLRCTGGACGCPGRTLGVYGNAVTGFTPREGARTLVLRHPDRAGWIAITGGRDENGDPSDAVELFGPQSAEREEYVLQTARRDAALFEDDEGRLFVIGGEDAQGVLLGSWERITPGSGGTVARDFAPPLRLAGVGVLPREGGVWLTGGRRTTPGTEIIDASLTTSSPTTSWAAVGEQVHPRHPGLPLQGGRTLFASSITPTETTELLEADGSITLGPTLPIALQDAAQAPLPGGRTLIAGGSRAQGGGVLQASAQAFILTETLEGLTVRTITPMPTAMARPKAVALENGWVYLEDETGSAVWFDPVSEHFVTATPPPGGLVRSALAPSGGRILRVGGRATQVVGEASFLDLRCQ